MMQPPLESSVKNNVYTQAQRGFQYLLDETPKAQDLEPSPRQTAFFLTKPGFP